MRFFVKFICIHQLLFLALFANNELQQEYFVQNKTIKLSNFVKNPKKDYILYKIDDSHHSKRVKSSQLLQKLKFYGYQDFSTKHTYIQFSQKSPINTQKIKDALVKFYKKSYKQIKIDNITIKPNRYINKLPRYYTIGFSHNAELSRKGVLYIKTEENKKIFFHYNLNATITVYETKKMIEKGDELSFLNTKKKSIILDKFHAMPILELPKERYEAKHRLKKFTILTKRDVTALFLVRRGTYVTVTLQDEGVNIVFSARAIQNGRYGDTIAVIHNNKKKIYVTVTGKNRVKVK